MFYLHVFCVFVFAPVEIRSRNTLITIIIIIIIIIYYDTLIHVTEWYAFKKHTSLYKEFFSKRSDNYSLRSQNFFVSGPTTHFNQNHIISTFRWPGLELVQEQKWACTILAFIALIAAMKCATYVEVVIRSGWVGAELTKYVGRSSSQDSNPCITECCWHMTNSRKWAHASVILSLVLRHLFYSRLSVHSMK